jgi:hypothetical protein
MHEKGSQRCGPFFFLWFPRSSDVECAPVEAALHAAHRSNDTDDSVNRYQIC